MSNEQQPVTDRRHQATCDWNLYPDDREELGDALCNIGCLDRPEEIAKSWAKLDAMPDSL